VAEAKRKLNSLKEQKLKRNQEAGSTLHKNSKNK
jgi:hypothetical protein